MRATTALAGVSLTLLLAGCSTFREVAVAEDCSMNATQIGVTYGSGHLTTNMECVEVAPNTTVTITFTKVDPQQPDRRIRTKSRGWGNRWLDNDAGGSPPTISIQVPADAGGNGGPKKEYKYEIHISDVGMLDPRIVVQ